jgi:hypothetical protein
MSNINYTYKDCSPADFAADESFDEALFSKKLETVFEMSLHLERVHMIFSKAKGHQFTVHIDGITNGKSNDVVLEGYEASETVRAAIKQFIQLMRDKKEKLKQH